MTAVVNGITHLTSDTFRLTVERDGVTEHCTFHRTGEGLLSGVHWDEPVEPLWDFAPLRALNKAALRIGQGEDVPLPLTLG
ncbi:hypothetical protein [Streptomyces sp. NPDC058572]|uniref:hypothetical protein n=1 Tax=Streptomyces sp. NPDC058572 TaxID=3346546 RepID=UPI0036576DC3